MPNYNFLKNILAEIESYKSEKGDYPNSNREFAYWLYNRMLPASIKEIDLEKYGIEHVENFGGNIMNSISYMITAMHRFKLHYLKMVLDNTALDNYDEISYLFSLVYNGPMTHSRLIDIHVQNKPTGTEIIKRLIKKQYVEQTPSTEDKRSKVLTVTPLGLKQFYIAVEKISALSEMVVHPLTDREVVDFYEITQKLYNAHRDIYTNERTTSLSEIINKYSISEKHKEHGKMTSPDLASNDSPS